MITTLDKKYQGYSRLFPKEHIDAMDAVLKLSGVRRWRASAAIWLNLNQMQESGMRAKDEYRELVDQLKEKRLSGLKNKFGEIETSSAVGGVGTREALEMPAGMWSYIKMFDKMSFESSNPDCKKNLEKLYREFKEFNVMERY